jgi:thiosulfate/3-mercaptopyruvate sulfurtransferase
MQEIAPIIQVTELLKLRQINDFVLLDASAGSKARFEESHLAGAQYIDLDTDLADIKDFANGGRHPLPPAEQFGKVLGKFGIDKDTHVIIYDDKYGGNAAARLWWMLKAIGHEKVQVLDGGFQVAVKAGYPTEAMVHEVESEKSYPATQWNLPLATIDEVEKASKTGDQTIVDVRDAKRYAGLTEPIDLIAGHIPGAINIPFTESLTETGTFLPPTTLKEKLEAALGGVPADQTIVHCGSGVTACHLLLALDYAGLPIPKLYVGSWSEWSRNEKEMVLANLP